MVIFILLIFCSFIPPSAIIGFFVHFDSKLNFTTALVPYQTNTSWIDKKIIEMKQTLDSQEVPEINKSCEKCMHLNAGKDFI